MDQEASVSGEGEEGGGAGAGLNATVTGAARTRPALRSSAARLVVVWPPELRQVIPLKSSELVLGRSPEDPKGRAIKHASVSRKHLTLRRNKRGQYVAKDLGSYNGTWVDGSRLGETGVSLSDGSVIRLSDVVLIYEALGAGRDGANVHPAAIPGESPRVMALRHLVQKAATDPSPVLIVGDTGTGKELVAREVHRLSGRSGEFVALNCAAVSPQLVESQLFGHEKGAFTGAAGPGKGLFRAADGGTLFLDELGEMDIALQPKLLRAIQEGVVRPVGSTRTHSVNVRVVAATNRDVVAEVQAGRFRRDLYARLALWELKVPALRERRGDILSWIDIMKARWCAARRVASAGPWSWSPEAVERLLLHPWPENLREVDRLVHRLLADGPDDEWIDTGDLDGVLTTAPEPSSHVSEDAAPAATTQVQRTAPTQEALEAAFEAHGGSVRAVAKHFGRDRKQIYRWMERYGLK